MAAKFPLSGWRADAVLRGRMMGALLLAMAALMTLSACTDKPKPYQTRWSAYYAAVDTPRAHVVVVPPTGTTMPMAKLIAAYVVEHIEKQGISAEVGDGKPGRGRHFILTGEAQENFTDPRVRFRRVLRWMLSDAGGRVISSYAQGVEGSDSEWDFGSARLLEDIGINAAGPVAQMVLVETKATTPIDPLRRGLLIDAVSGLPPADAQLLADAVKDALRTSDVLVTGDPRQAAFRLAGNVETTPVQGDLTHVRITWTVSTLNGEKWGQAIQENQIAAAQIEGGWGALAGVIGQAAALGVEHVFGVRPGPPPGAPNRAKGAPPPIILPGEPGRAPPPPQ